MTLTNHEINILQHGVINCVIFGATGATTFEKTVIKLYIPVVILST